MTFATYILVSKIGFTFVNSVYIYIYIYIYLRHIKYININIKYIHKVAIKLLMLVIFKYTGGPLKHDW